MGEVNRAWRLAAHPKGDVSPADFELTEEPLPQIEDGQILVRNLYLSVDPAMRVWITGRKTYVDGVQVGQVMPSSAVGRIVESKRTGFEVGEHVVGMFGWRDYCATDGRGLVPINKIPPGIRVTAALGTLGINGLTAYFGLLDVGQLEPGQTVLVSGAAGATGSIAGQIAKAKDCRVIGIAGGEQKCNWLTGEAHFDAAVDYKADGALERLGELCPKGCNVFFDNVGGSILEAGLNHLAMRARVVLCGAISSYNQGMPQTGPRNYMNLLVKRARMEGFVVLDYAEQFPMALAELAGWLASGAIVDREDIVEGLENTPAALVRLFEGKNQGKQLVKVAAG